MIRTVHVEEITKNIKEMCIEANHYLSEDMDVAMKQAVETEKAPLGKQILTQLQENLQIAAKDMIPICQDTGMAVVFVDIGQKFISRVDNWKKLSTKESVRDTQKDILENPL